MLAVLKSDGCPAMLTETTVLSAKKTSCSDLRIKICACAMEARSNIFFLALSHYCFQSFHVYFPLLSTHTFCLTDAPVKLNKTPPTSVQLENQSSIKTFTSQSVHEDRYFPLELQGLLSSAKKKNNRWKVCFVIFVTRSLEIPNSTVEYDLSYIIYPYICKISLRISHPQNPQETSQTPHIR